MKLIKSFDKFLEDEVNLNKTRLVRITDGFETISRFLRANTVFKGKIRDITPQGSYRQKTIIKPATDNLDFDVDMLMTVAPVAGWEPKDYINKLHADFKNTQMYEDIVDDKRGKNRCVTLNYESDFHIDIVPSIQTAGADYIMNRSTNEYEPTDADGYANWFSGCDALVGNSNLVKCVRLLKYLRDRKDIPMKSVLLTTLVGTRVLATDSKLIYPDLPTSFKCLTNRLDDYLQSLTTVPKVINPSLPSEDFNRHWEQAKFTQAKNKIHDIRLKLDKAYSATDLEQSHELWQEVLGEEFPLAEDDAPQIQPLALGNAAHCQPVTLIPGCSGERINPAIRIRVNGYLYSKDGKKKFRGINTDARIPSGVAIKYVASTNASEPYELYWQVVNTGLHAQRENGLRGTYFKAKALEGKPSSKHINWETSLYTGKHWIECFMVQNGYCIARSGRFFVNIKNPLF